MNQWESMWKSMRENKNGVLVVNVFEKVISKKKICFAFERHFKAFQFIRYCDFFFVHWIGCVRTGLCLKKAKIGFSPFFYIDVTQTHKRNVGWIIRFHFCAHKNAIYIHSYGFRSFRLNDWPRLKVFMWYLTAI